jgi:dTDP-4-dehydrorhamnose 3,5-epimerase
VKVLATELPGVLVVEPDVFGDSRGFFMESWNGARYQEHGIEDHFVQDNLSFSARDVLRGLHFQNPRAQGKLVSVLQGEVFDVAVDIRVGSPTFGRWTGATLSAENRRQFWVPPGFAHGFVVTAENALFSYKCTDYYAPEYDGSILWNDPAIGIRWPVENPSLSDKDRAAPPLEAMPEERLPRYTGG